jgi:WD40 repeat protein
MGTISIAETQSGRHVRELGDPETGIVCSICFSPNGKVLAAARYSGLKFPPTDGTIQLWDMVTGKKLLDWDTQGDGIASLNFSPDGKKIGSLTKKIASFTATGHLAVKQATVSFWDSETGKRVGAPIKSPTGILCFAFSPDRKTIATGHVDHVIRIWDMNGGKEKCELSGHQGPVGCLTFSKDARFLVSGSKDTSIIVWELAKGLHSSKEE